MRVLVALFALALCAASATSYQEKGAVFGHGYSESALGGGRFTVDFNGNGWTSLAAAISYAHRRAGELCGGEYDVLDSHTTTDGDGGHPDVVITIRCR